ncbi:MAG: hypothetical protein ACYSUV_17695 [Planctomycetota bacterium]
MAILRGKILLVCALAVLGGFVATAAAEPNAVETDVFENSLWEQEFVSPSGTVIVVMTGTSTVEVFFEGPTEGEADDDTGNGLEEVPTEMAALNVSGYSLLFGAVEMRVNAAIPATGQMEEVSNATAGVLDVLPFAGSGSIESFFDVYLEIDVGGMRWYSQGPLRLSSLLDSKPAGPGDVYENSAPVTLLDEMGVPTGWQLGAAQYAPNLLVEIDTFVGSTCEANVMTPAGGPYTVELEGNSTAHVFFEGETEGSADDDTYNGRDEVLTELVELNVSGDSEALGLVRLGLNTSVPALGRMEEDANNTAGVLDVPPFATTGTVESSFDAMIEVEIDGTPMHGQTPVRWSGQFTEKPAALGESYESDDLVELFDDDGLPTGCSIQVFRYTPRPCGDATHPYPVGDFNLDCLVNFLDFAIFSQHWLDCTRGECH